MGKKGGGQPTSPESPNDIEDKSTGRQTTSIYWCFHYGSVDLSQLSTHTQLGQASLGRTLVHSKARRPLALFEIEQEIPFSVFFFSFFVFFSLFRLFGSTKLEGGFTKLDQQEGEEKTKNLECFALSNQVRVEVHTGGSVADN
ncbi:hypothetical protein FXO38_11933 [Capsicum annuum]|nr:hypothetical protein FXO38_11933 [Capsicum annuum]